MNATQSVTFFLKVVSAIVLFIYPFAIYFGLTHWGIQAIAPLLFALFFCRLLFTKAKIQQLSWLIKAIACVGILLVSASWLLKQTQWLLYYPVAVSVIMLMLFSYSLIKPPSIVERLARLSEPDLDDKGQRYTRQVTKIWCLFFILNGFTALVTCLYGDLTLWTLYNGAISYMLMALLMGGEWLVRKRIRQSDTFQQESDLQENE